MVRMMADLSLTLGSADAYFNAGGFRADLDAGDGLQPVTDLGTYWLPDSPRRVRVAQGGSADDALAGTGARVLFVFGLDAQYRLAARALFTNGASASEFAERNLKDPSLVEPATFRRVFRVVVAQAGTATVGGALAANASDILLEDEAGDPVMLVPQGRGWGSHSHFTVPSGFTGAVTSILFTVGQSGENQALGLLVNQGAGQPPVAIASFSGTQLNINVPNPVFLDEREDVWALARLITSNNAVVNCILFLQLRRKLRTTTDRELFRELLP